MHTHIWVCALFSLKTSVLFIYFFIILFFNFVWLQKFMLTTPLQYFQWAYSPKKLWEAQVCTDAHSAKSHHSFHTTCTLQGLEKAFRKTMQDHFYSHNRLNRSNQWFSIHNSLSLLGENQVFQLLE